MQYDAIFSIRKLTAAVKTVKFSSRVYVFEMNTFIAFPAFMKS